MIDGWFCVCNEKNGLENEVYNDFKKNWDRRGISVNGHLSSSNYSILGQNSMALRCQNVLKSSSRALRASLLMICCSAAKNTISRNDAESVWKSICFC